MFSVPPVFQHDSDLLSLIKKVGACPLQRDSLPSKNASLYDSLVKSVIGQQLHNAAAQTIFSRLCALNIEEPSRPPSPSRLLQLSDQSLRQCGISFTKIETLRRIAHARQDGTIPSLHEAITWDDDTLIKHLTSLKGIGVWTANMLLLFTLHRPDIMPANDLGVQEGWRRLKRLKKRPTPALLKKQTASFAPHRSQLTWYCWQAKEHLPACISTEKELP